MTDGSDQPDVRPIGASAHVAPRVLIAHDYVTQRGGAERVVLSLLRAFPGARLLTSIYEPSGSYPEFSQYHVRTLWTNRVKAFRRDPRRAMPFLAAAFELADVKDVDAVICSSSGWSHGLRTEAPKVVYCHTPARWLYATEDYLPEVPMPLRPAIRAAVPALRRWDSHAAASASVYLANSSTVQARIERAYRRSSTTLHPPVALDANGPHEAIKGIEPGYLLTVSRTRRYKHAEAICRAVEESCGERLVVVGGLPLRSDGSQWPARLQGVTGVSDAQMRWLYANASALVAVSHEDFGLTPVEAYSFGTPAILLRAGGYLDSSIEGVTCVFVNKPDVGSLREGLARFRERTFSSDELRQHAEGFSEAAFQRTIRAVVADVVQADVASTAASRSTARFPSAGRQRFPRDEQRTSYIRV